MKLNGKLVICNDLATDPPEKKKCDEEFAETIAKLPQGSEERSEFGEKVGCGREPDCEPVEKCVKAKANKIAAKRACNEEIKSCMRLYSRCDRGEGKFSTLFP